MIHVSRLVLKILLQNTTIWRRGWLLTCLYLHRSCLAQANLNRLLLEADLTLAKATSLALQMEAGLRNAGVLSDTTTTAAAASVRAIHKQQRKARQKEQRTPASSKSPTTSHRSCYCCGSTNHLANKPSSHVDLDKGRCVK